MRKTILPAMLLASFQTFDAYAAPGDYDPAYDQGGGYGAATLDERVAKLEKRLSGEAQIETLNRLEHLQSEMSRLRGELEEMSHRLDTAKRQQKEQWQELDRRVQALTPVAPAATEPGTQPDPAPSAEAEPDAASTPPVQLAPPPSVPSPPPVAPPPAATMPFSATYAPLPNQSPPPPPKPPAPAEPAKPLMPSFAVSTKAAPPPAPVSAADSAARQAAYQKGFGLMKDGKYAEAVKELKSFLEAYPKGEYADNAAYWLAEAHYVNRDLPAAREAFRRVVKDFPQAAKVSDAELKLGYIDYDSKQWAAAKDSLNEVIRRYPDSNAAKLAQKRLDKMVQEGH